MSQSERPVGVVCGSDSLIGNALVSRLAGEGWDIVTIDGQGGRRARSARASAPKVTSRWPGLGSSTERIVDRVGNHASSSTLQLRPLIQPPSSISPKTSGSLSSIAICAAPFSAAGTSCRCCPRDEGSVVLVGSVLAGWDTRVDTGALGASQAGLLGLMRALTLAGGPRGHPCQHCLPRSRHGVARDLPAEVRGRIPLGAPPNPADMVEAIRFLLLPTPVTSTAARSSSTAANRCKAGATPLATGTTL